MPADFCHGLLAPLAAALLTAPQALFDDEADRDALLDAWWTQVVYHGSLKGVGISHNALVTDVRDFGRRLAHELRHENVEAPDRDFDDGVVESKSAQEFEAALALPVPHILR